jgi:hypothetical protein
MLHYETVHQLARDRGDQLRGEAQSERLAREARSRSEARQEAAHTHRRRRPRPIWLWSSPHV